jgi:F-type H+-transporting ATPase subunit delta
MKISARQYAQSLYESVANRPEKEVRAILKNFVEILGRGRELSKAPAIIERFKEVWAKEKGELAAELFSARELGPTIRELVIDYIKEKTGAKKINLQEKIKPELIGGFVLHYNDKIIDGSLKNSLEILRNKISN